MILKEKELLEYIKCPLRFNIIKNGIDIDNNKTFNQFVYDVSKYLFLSTLDKPITNSKVLKNKWDSICMNNKELITPKQVSEGWGLIYRTFEYVYYNQIKFIDVNQAYKIEIPGTGICLTGVLDPIIDRGDHIEIFISSYSRKVPEKIDIDTKLKHTIDAYVIKKIYNKDVVIKYHSFTKGMDIYSFRDEKSFKRLESILKNVGQAINANIIYPRETYMCSSCIAREFCIEWTGK